MNMNETSIGIIREYYGKILKTNRDLKTNVCCTAEKLPSRLRDIVKLIHPDVQEKFYGCGSPIPEALEGRTVLDLGCGAGRDCFLLSKLVGPKGRVIGIDMTKEQLAIAQRYLPFHTEKFGFTKPNIEFIEGFIEDVEGLGIKNDSIDVIISNCVMNLSPNKHRLFSQIFHSLKPGGELYFSDVFSDRRIPRHLAQDPILIGECLGGALYIQDFRRLLAEIGCQDYRIVSQNRMAIHNPDIEKKVAPIDFYSMTIRAFKLNLEDRCEDYGQVAYYLGTIPESPHSFMLDDHHFFETGKAVPICGNTAAMLTQTRYGKHFKIIGDTSRHYGLFDCNPRSEKIQKNSASLACC